MLALALTGTLWLWRYVLDNVNAKDQARFEIRVERTAQVITDHLHNFEQLLRGQQRWLAASRNVTRCDWRTYVEGLPLGEHYPGIVGLMYIRSVAHSELPKFLDAVRADSAPSFTIHPRGTREQYWCVQYAEPVIRNEPLLGHDYAVNPIVRGALESARDEARFAITPPTHLEGDSARHPSGRMLIMPVYRSDVAPRTVAERRAALTGWVTALLQTTDLLNHVVDRLAVDLHCTLMHEADASDASRQPSLAGGSPGRIRRIRIGGTTLALLFRPSPSFLTVADRSAPHVALAAGLLISGLLYWLTYSMHRTRSLAVAIARQMTAALAEREAQAQRLAIRASEAAQAKSDFLANISHEIRTPMTAILGYVEILADPGFGDADKAAAVETIRRNGEHLLTLVNDILDLSRIERGGMPIERARCALHPVIHDVAALMRMRAVAKKLRLDVRIDSDVPQAVWTDPTRLRQILINLVGNAIKFTAEGGVTLHACGEQSGGANPGVTIAVSDTGIGIDANMLPQLFEPFVQADTSHTRQFGGAGLGLSISRRLARMLGGDISVTSRPGHGSTFVLRVPLEPCDAADAQTPSAAAESPVPDSPADDAVLSGRVLLAEDGPDNQRFIQRVIQRAGAEVTIVDNGRAAVDAALAALESGTPFDIILMDVQMPMLDGCSATRMLRDHGYRGHIVALTAHGSDLDRQNCIAAGCDDHESKPIDRRRILQLLRRHGLRLRDQDYSSRCETSGSAPASRSSTNRQEVHA